MPDQSTPFLHHPEMVDDHSRNGLVCFNDKDRPCGSDCMAWGNVPSGKDYIGQQWANCQVLVNNYRTGKHLTIIAEVLSLHTQKARALADDKVRLAQTPPPVPR